MEVHNPMLLYVIYLGKQANSTSGAHTSLHGGHNCLLWDESLPPPPNVMMDHIRAELDVDAVTWW
jgi:hypothetical protein